MGEGKKVAEEWLDRIKQVLEKRREWENNGRSIIKEYQCRGRRSDPVPLLHRLTKLLLAYLYYRDPKPVVQAVRNDEWVLARAMENNLTNVRDILGLRAINRRVVLDALLTDLGVCKIAAVRRAGEQAIDLMRVSPFDFVFDPTSLGVLDDARWCAQRIFKPVDLVKRNKIYRNTEKIEGRYEIDIRGGEAEYQEAAGGTDEWRRLVKLWEIYYRDDDGIYILTIADDYAPILLREEKYESPVGDFPFINLSFNPVPDQPYGISVLYVLKPLHVMLNRAMRQALEKAGKKISALAINDLIENSEDIEDALSEENGVGQILRVKGDIASAIQPIEVGGIKQDDVSLLQIIMEMVHRVSGITQAQMSGIVMGRKTATEAQMIQQASTITMSDLSDDVENYVEKQFRQLGRWLWDARRWGKDAFHPGWLSDEEYAAWVGAAAEAIEGLRIGVERGSGAVMWHREKAQEMQMIMQVLSNPLIQEQMEKEGYHVNVAALVERWLMHMGIRDTGAIVKQVEGVRSGEDIFGGALPMGEREAQGGTGTLRMGQETEEMGAGWRGAGGVAGEALLPEGGGGEGVF